jgi:hypothetical protein
MWRALKAEKGTIAARKETFVCPAMNVAGQLATTLTNHETTCTARARNGAEVQRLERAMTIPRQL